MHVEKIAYEKGYYVDKYGNVFNIYNKKRKIYLDSKKNYYIFSLRFGNKIMCCYVHKLVAYQKFGDIIYESNYDIRHLNNNKIDNSWNNINFGTKSQNMMDTPKEERQKHAKHASSFIIKYEANEIIDFYNKCRSYKETMNHFNISSKGTLHYILNKRK
jgi:hypothetical protein